MIDIIFYFGTEIVLVRVDGTNVQFANSAYGAKMSTLNGMKLSKSGVVKEFPDLKDDNDWRAKAIQRFNNKIKEFPTEEERVNFIIEDLKKFGYIPKFKQKIGFRREKI